MKPLFARAWIQPMLALLLWAAPAEAWTAPPQPAGPEAREQGIRDACAAVERRITRAVLPGGLKVAMLQRPESAGGVALFLRLRLGTESALQGRQGAADLCTAMLFCGTRTRSAERLKADFLKLGANPETSAQNDEMTVKVETTRAGLPALLRLLADMLRNPAFPKAGLARVRREKLAQQEEAANSAAELGGIWLWQRLNPYPAGHPLAVESPQQKRASLLAATLKDVRAFHHDLFGAVGELAMVGDLEPGPTQALLESLFGNWRAATPWQRIPRRFTEIPPESKTFNLPVGSVARFEAGTLLPLRRDDPDWLALELATSILVRDTRVRFKQAHPGAAGTAIDLETVLEPGAEDPCSCWRLAGTADAGQLDALVQAFREACAQARAEGYGPEALQRAKVDAQWLQSGVMVSDERCAEWLANQLAAGGDMAQEAARTIRTQALTPEQVRQAIRKYLDPEKMVMIKAGPLTPPK